MGDTLAVPGSMHMERACAFSSFLFSGNRVCEMQHSEIIQTNVFNLEHCIYLSFGEAHPPTAVGGDNSIKCAIAEMEAPMTIPRTRTAILCRNASVRRGAHLWFRRLE